MNLEQIAKEARIKVLELIYKAGTSHIGSCLSSVDIMAILFETANPKKDEVILSAGWKAAAWYYFLWRKGIITEEELNSFCQSGSKFIGLVEPIDNRWGLKIGTGSMGLGLPCAVGLALSKKMKGEDGIIYCLMSDGEMAIGTTHEALLIAKQHELTNLVVLVDLNGLQAMGKTTDILRLYIHPALCHSHFAWDGHNFKELKKAITPGGGLLRFLITVKGKGVSFMEGNNLWHYAQIKEEDYNKAIAELNR